jgi:uncharacterized protein (TIGR00251 family)
MGQYIRKSKTGYAINLYIQPGSRKTEIVGLHDGALKIKIAAQATDNQANEAVLRFLQKKLQLRKQDLELIQGEKSRHKVIEVQGISEEQIIDCLKVSSFSS